MESSTSTLSLDSSWRVDPPIAFGSSSSKSFDPSSSGNGLSMSISGMDGGWGSTSGIGAGGSSGSMTWPRSAGFPAIVSGAGTSAHERTGSASSAKIHFPSAPSTSLDFTHPLIPYMQPSSAAALASSKPLGMDMDSKGKGKGKQLDTGEKKDEDDERDHVDLVTGVKVWAGVMDTSKGRDKVLKCGQYSLRTYLYILSLIARVRPLSPWFKSNRKRMQLAVSGLSLTRKCLLLLNPLHPIAELLSPHPTSASELILHLIDLASALSDDIFCLSKLGITSKRLGKKADTWANRLWFLSTLIGLYKLHLTKIARIRTKLATLALTTSSTATVEEDKAQRKLIQAQKRDLVDAQWTNRKFLADFVFVSYDVFGLSWCEEPIKCCAGLIAAFISTSKIYDQRVASMGKG